MRINKKIIALLFLVLLLVLAFYPLPEIEPNRYVERESGVVKTEKVAGENWLKWLYYNPVGEATMFTLIKRKFFSSWYGDMMESPSSAKKIIPFIEDYQIEMSIVQNQEYSSFNEFFIRKFKKSAREIDSTPNVIVSPADGKILAYANISNTDFLIKGCRFDVESFLDNDELGKKYENGSLIIIRLAPYDYHRFHFPVCGKVSTQVKIDGYLYSVNPIALQKMIEIFFLNKREYVSISNQQIGKVIMAEVGATMVGSIIQTYKGDTAIIGNEKGYFKFGGSTIVLLFEKDKINIDEDLINNSVDGFETEVKMGEKIASFSSMFQH
jgi:phosphatidylserine decarboxylase